MIKIRRFPTAQSGSFITWKYTQDVGLVPNRFVWLCLFPSPEFDEHCSSVLLPFFLHSSTQRPGIYTATFSLSSVQ